MDLKQLKEKAIKLKNEVIEFKNKQINTQAKKLEESELVIKTKEEFDIFIAKSKNTSFTSKETGKTKIFTKYAILIILGKESDYYKDLLFEIPIIKTKAFASSVEFALADPELEDIKKLKLKTLPSLVLFSNSKKIKIIEGKENIKKIVKTLNLDIIKTIQEL